MLPCHPALRPFGAKSLRLLSIFLTTILLLISARQSSAQVVFNGAANTLGSASSGDTISPPAVDANGDLFYVVSNGSTNTLYKVPAGGSPTILNSAFPQFPSALAVNPAGTTLFFIYNGSTPQSCITSVPDYVYLAAVSTTPNASPSNMPACFTNFGYNASYTDPTGLAMDSSGNLYVADYGAGVIWKLVSTVTASTVPTYMLELTQQPYDVAVNGGTVYYTALDFNNSSNNTLFSASASGFTSGIPSGPAGASALKVVLSIQNGLAVDSNSNVYIGSGSSVQEYKGGSLTTVDSSLSGGVSGVAVDSSGHLYETGLDSSGTPLASEISAQSVSFGSVNVGSTGGPVSLGFTIGASGSTTVGSIHVYAAGGDSLDFANASGSTCTAKTYATSTTCNLNVSFSPRVAGLRSGAVVFYDGSGNVLSTVYVYGSGAGPQLTFGPGTQTSLGSGLSTPLGTVVDANGNLYIADSSSNRVVELPWTGSSYGAQTSVITGLSGPRGLAIDGAGNLFITDAGNNRVLKLPWTGSGFGTQTTVGTSLNAPSGVTVDGSGDVFIADTGNNRVVRVPWNGSSYGTQGTVGSGLHSPEGLAVDSAGNLYIADALNNRVVKEPWNGSSFGTQSALGTALTTPAGVAVDGAGNVYVADYGAAQVVKVPWNGSSYGTESAVVSSLSSPAGLAIDGKGNLYIGDSGNNRVVKLDLSDAPSLSFGSSSVGVQSPDSPLSFTVSNIGTASAQFPVPGSGGNPSIASGFTFDGATTCPQLTSSSSTGSISAGSTCEYAIDFIPVTGGAASGSLVLKDNNLNAHYTTQSISLSGTASSISVTPASIPAATVGVAYSQSFTGGGGTGPYTFAVTSGSLPAGLSLSSAGTLSGTPTAGGTFNFSITATDSASASSAQAFALTVNVPTITVSPSSLAGTSIGVVVTQTVSASGGIAPYTFAVTAGALPAGLSLSSNGTLSGTPTAAGTFNFTVTATDSSTGTGPYTGSRAYTFTVGAPTITLTPLSLPGGTYNSAYSQSFSASGGITNYTYAITAGSLPSGMTLSSAGVLSGTPTAVGTFTFTVSATDSSTGTGPFTGSQAYILTIAQASQTITFTPPTSPVNYGVAPITLTATSTSNLAVTFSVVSGPATVSGNTLTITGAGTIVVAANQAGDANYQAAAQVTQTLVVNQATQTITFTPPASPVNYGVAPITLAATTTSNLPITFSVVSGPGTVTGNTLTVTGVGTIIVAANQAGNANYQAATQVTQSIVVNQASQTITFTPPASPVNYGVAPITLSATATSNLPITFSVVSGPGTVTSNTLTLTGVGTIVVAANQAGNTNYQAAAQVTQSIVVNQASQTITFTAPASPVAYGAAPITLSATSTSNLAVTFSVVSGPGTITGNTVTITGVGTIVIAANQAGNANYQAAAQVTQSIVVNQATLTVSAANATRVYGTANPSFTGSVNGAVNGDTFTESFTTAAIATSNVGTYAIVPSVSGSNLANYQVTIQNGTLTITQAGTITALTSNNSTITPGQSVTLTALVTSATSGTPTGTVSFYDGTALLATSPLTSGAATYSTSALAPGLTHTLTAVYSGDINFTTSTTTASTTVVVAPLDFNLSVTGATKLSVIPGGSVAYQVTVDPLYGSYAGPVSFTVTGLPAGATFTTNPSSIPVGGGKTVVTLTIQTAAVAALHSKPSIGQKMAPIALGLLLLPFAGAGRLRRNGRRIRQMLSVLLLLVGIAAVANMTGCGSPDGFFAQKQQSYDVTITATAGGLQHTTSVTLEVQ